jgi:hypothetical protein
MNACYCWVDACWVMRLDTIGYVVVVRIWMQPLFMMRVGRVRRVGVVKWEKVNAVVGLTKEARRGWADVREWLCWSYHFWGYQSM